MNKIWIMLAIATIISCQSNDDNSEDQLIIPALLISQSNNCTGNANYTLTFNSTWSATTHPTDFPADPHFSGLIGATHSSRVTFWSAGSPATSGIKEMAERGRKIELTNEVTSAINAGTAFSVLSGDNLDNSPGSVTFTFDITQSFPLVTMVTMIAPSPDWFVGVSGISLCENNQWVATKSIDLFAYDSGTDSGSTFTSENAITSPPGVITRLTSGIFFVNNQVPKLGTFTFQKNSGL
ncbi:spondin domain-containing protein [Leptospira sp. GIMC2001]|uniref:spondin domain-containing protein n=1 Tax=Leptospira sp. GIMC2001 TaxID=1513297 RepID=UPI0023497A28|nr:spondin domain-containing protein [Leptospira sp. GIMC2001]WCL49718.1 spondin domain-containing protein [Leptospira sp. GIMC2001]